jgi:hypothetical protein
MTGPPFPWYYKYTNFDRNSVPEFDWYYTFVLSETPSRGFRNPWFGGIGHPAEAVFPQFDWKPEGQERLRGCQVFYTKAAIARSCKPDIFINTKAKYAILMIDCRTSQFVDVTLEVVTPANYATWEAVAFGCPPGSSDDIVDEPYWYPTITCPP